MKIDIWTSERFGKCGWGEYEVIDFDNFQKDLQKFGLEMFVEQNPISFSELWGNWTDIKLLSEFLRKFSSDKCALEFSFLDEGKYVEFKIYIKNLQNATGR